MRLLCDHTELGLLAVSGPDAAKLLQGQLTCDVEKITATHSSMGAMCNPQGRVISLFYLFLQQNTYYLLMHRQMVPITLEAIKKYAVFYKVQLADASDALNIIAYSIDNDHSSTTPNISTIQASISTPRYFAVGEPATINTLIKQFTPHSSLVTWREWKLLDIQDRIPTIYPQTSGKFLPHDLNLHKLHAIDFDKGCYTGQEIIARMHYRGKLKNHLSHLQLICDKPPQPGTEYEHQLLVDACSSIHNQYDVLLITATQDPT